MACNHLVTCCTIFVLGKNKWVNLFEKVANFKTYRKPKNFENENKKINIYSIIYILYCNGGLLLNCLIAKYNKSECLEINTKRALKEQCGYYMPVWFPFELIFPWNEIFFALQFTACLILIPPAAAIYYLPFEVAMHIEIRIDDLKNV